MNSKRYIIFAIVFLTAIVFWLLVKPWVEGPVKFADWQNWIGPLGALLVLATFTATAFLVVREWLWRVVISLLIGVAFLLVFDFNPLYPGTFSTLLLMHLWAGRNINQELEERLKINSLALMRRSLPWLITPLLIIVSFAYYLDPVVQSAGRSQQLPPTVKEAIQRTVDTFLGGELAQLPANQRASAKNQIVAEAMRLLNNLLEPFAKFLPPLIAFGFFLILQGLSYVFVWLSVWLGMGLLWLLRKTEFIKVEKRTVEAETIIYGN